MKIPLVDLQAQYRVIKDEVDEAVSAVISSAAFVGGDFVNRFEQEFASYCGTRYCVGLGNGTDALFVALKALGIGPGDEVVTAANSFIATSEAITMTSARVVFVDIDPSTYNLDPNLLEAKITEKTKAVVPVHLYGQPADMAPIVDIASRRGLAVIGDAAQAHGALYRGKPVAQWSDITCYSFYPGKNLGAYGDGGALVTNNRQWADRARMFANHGRLSKYDHEFEGVNSRLDALQAAILSVKLKHLEQWTEARRRNARIYSELFTDAACLLTPVEIEDVRAVYHLYVVRVPGKTRSDIQEHLKANGISTGIHYPIALPYLQAYRYLGYGEDDYPEARRASGEILSLPMYAELSPEQIERVASSLLAAQRVPSTP